MADLKAAAHEYWSQGCNVVALKGKQPLVSWSLWQFRRQSDAEFEGLPWNQADGFGVICGTQLSNGLYFAAIDFDIKNLPTETIEKGKQVLKNMLCTQLEETPSGGQHWIYFCHNKPKTVSAFHNECALELLGEGKLCIMAPSEGYKRLNDNIPSILNDLEQTLYEPMWKVGIKPKQDKKEVWFDRTDLADKQFKGKSPPCIDRLISGTTEGLRNEYCIRLSAYLCNFRKLESKKAWKKIEEWNKWNNPPLPSSELRAVFQSAVKNRYVYGCSDSILASLCEKENCTLAKKHADSSPERVFDPQVEAEINSELSKILNAENQLTVLKPHLDLVVVGEEEGKTAIFVLLSGSKYPEHEFKQILLLKGTEGSGKSTLMRHLSEGYKVKDVGRFSAHALDYANLEGYEVLSLKELGSMDMEQQGVSTIKFLSSDDRGYTVEVTVKNEETGRFSTESYRIPPITVISSTTRLVLDSQFERRAWLFGMDESPEQTKRIAEWKAQNEREKAEVLLGKKAITSFEFSREVIRRFVQKIKPEKIIIPFPKTLSELLGFNVLRVRGDIDKLFTFLRLYAAFNTRRLAKLKEDIYVVTPEVCMEALQIIGRPLTNMLSSVDERVRGILSALKQTKDIEMRTFEIDGQRQEHELEVRFDIKGSEIDRKVREQIATRIGKSERTIRRFFDSLENSGYVSCDQKKPKTYTLLYDVEEIEAKLKGILDICHLSNSLMDKMAKEAQEWLKTTLDNQAPLDGEKIFRKEYVSGHNIYEKKLLPSTGEKLSNPVLGSNQAPSEKITLSNWTNTKCPTCRGDNSLDLANVAKLEPLAVPSDFKNEKCVKCGIRGTAWLATLKDDSYGFLCGSCGSKLETELQKVKQ